MVFLNTITAESGREKQTNPRLTTGTAGVSPAMSAQRERRFVPKPVADLLNLLTIVVFELKSGVG
jgi:hypothetical protein